MQCDDTNARTALIVILASCSRFANYESNTHIVIMPITRVAMPIVRFVSAVAVAVAGVGVGARVGEGVGVGIVVE